MPSVSYDTFLKENSAPAIKSSPVSYSSFQQSQTKPKVNSVSYAAFEQEKNAPPTIPISTKIKTAVGDYAKASEQTVYDTGNAILHPIETAKSAYQSVKKDLVANVEKAGAGERALFGKDSSIAERVAGGANTLVGLGSILLTPITESFKLASHIPGLKQVADVISVPFTAAGMAGSFASGKAIDLIPENILDKETKEIVKSPLQDLTSFAAQIYLGGKIMGKIGEFTKNGKKITPIDARKIVAESKSEVNKIEMKTPEKIHSEALAVDLPKYMESVKKGEMTMDQAFSTLKERYPLNTTEITNRFSEYNKSLGYEPYVAPADLPTIPLGVRPKSELPVIDSTTGKPVEAKAPAVKGDLVVEPIKTPSVSYESFLQETKTPAPKAAKIEAPVEVVEKPVVSTPKNVPTKPIEEGPTTKPTKLASTLEADTVAKGIEADFGKSPEYSTMNMRDQAVKAIEVIKDTKRTNDILEGKVTPPEGIKLGSVYTAAKLDAIKRGDVNRINELSRSKVNELASSYGQEVKAFDSNIANDPVRIIKEVRETRAKNNEKASRVRTAKAITEEIKVEVKKKTPTKQDWEGFIRNLECP